MSGYVRLHRSLIGHPAFRNDAEAMAFAWMIARAAWKPARVRYKGRAINLGRGQLAISVRDMAAAMDRDKAWIERLFTRLRRETMIETVIEAGLSLITIKNYDVFQPNGHDAETSGETVDETEARQRQDTEQGREIREEKNTSEAKASSVARTRAHPFPCPAGVDPQHWSDFRAARRKKRCTDSLSAYTAILKDLMEFSTGEWPPGRLVQRSAEKGWASIVNPNDSNQDHRNGRQLQPANSLRGSRPDPSLDMLRQAQAEIRASENQGDDSASWTSLPSYRAN